MSDKQSLFYLNDDVKVTEQLLSVGGKSYSIRNITSHRIVTYSPSTAVPVMICAFAFVVFVYAIISFPRDPSAPIAGAVIALIMLGLGVWMFKSGRPSYELVIRTAGEENVTIRSLNLERVKQISSALDAAMSA